MRNSAIQQSSPGSSKDHLQGKDRNERKIWGQKRLNKNTSETRDIAQRASKQDLSTGDPGSISSIIVSLKDCFGANQRTTSCDPSLPT